MSRNPKQNYGNIDMRSNNKKIIIINIVVLILALASVLTLALGNFFAVKVKFDLDADSFQDLFDLGEVDEMPVEMQDLNVSIPIAFQLKGPFLLQSLTGDPIETIEKMMLDQVNSFLPMLKDLVSSFVKTFVASMLREQERHAKDAIADMLRDEGIENPTDEQISQRLEDEYGLSQSELEDLNNDFVEAFEAFMTDGATGAIDSLLDNSTSLNALFLVIAEEDLGADGGSFTQEELDAKVQEMKDEMRGELHDMTSELSIDGEPVTLESALVVMLNEALEGEENFETIDDVKNYMVEKMLSILDDDIAEFIAIPLKVLGGFLLLVILSWAYLIVKILVKFFAKNKTVGMLAPKLIAWTPYTILVILPTLLLKNIGSILQKVGADSETVETISTMLKQINVKFSALTWVSAVSVLILMIIWFPYRKLRKESKRAKKM